MEIPHTLNIDPEHARRLAHDLQASADRPTPTPGAPPLPDPPLARFTSALSGALTVVATRTENVHARARDLAAVSLDLVAVAEDVDGHLARRLGRLG